MTKTVSIAQPRKAQAEPPRVDLDAFVSGPADEGATVKLSVRLPDDLHRRVKISLAHTRGDSLQARVIRLLEADLQAETASRHRGNAA